MPKVLGEIEASNLGGFELRKKDKIYTRRQTYERSYYVLSDDIFQNELEILVTTGVPVLFSLIGGAFCVEKKGKELSRVRHPSTGAQAVLWEVSCRFDSDVDVEEADQPPEARTPKIRWYGENEDELVRRDVRTGDPIVTVPGEPIIVEAPVVRPILEIKRYGVFPFSPIIQLDYANHVNSTPFWGAPKGCAWMQPINVEEETIEGTKYNLETYVIKFKMQRDPDTGEFIEDTWQAQPLHQGTLEKYVKEVNIFNPEEGIDVRVAQDENRQPLTVNLDADGFRLIPPDDGPDNYVYLKFWHLYQADLNTLNLGPFS